MNRCVSLCDRSIRSGPGHKPSHPRVRRFGTVETGKIVNRCSGTSLTVKGVGLDWQWIKINGVVAIFDLLAASQVGEAEPLPAKKYIVGIWAMGLAKGDG